ncbi:MAG: hypothetical protein AB7G75_06195 [Candidatus Binatia bacterium]
MFRKVPLLAYLIVVYNIITLVWGEAALGNAVVSTRLLSGGQFTLMLGDLLILLGVIFLYIEIYKATRTSTAAVLDHILSTLLLIICVVEFLIVPPAGTSVYLILSLMVLLDLVAGFTVSISTARRDLAVDERL